ncbi:MAG: hypothetical protein AB2693_22575 [Candidatus Thiodiazotropha sp.]
MEWYSRVISNIFRHFNNSALRENKLREIQNLLEQPQLKYTDIHSVHWLSMENAVNILYRTYPSLCATLSHMAASGDIVAKSLYHDVSQYKFIALTHLLMDILPFIGRLSKVFQTEVLDFSKVPPMVQSACESLTDLIECEGVFVDKLCQFITSDEEGNDVTYIRPVKESASKTIKEGKENNVNFEGFSESEDTPDNTNEVKLSYYRQQKSLVPKVSETYINSIVQNLEDRFENKDLINHMDALVPATIASQSSIGNFGVDAVCALTTNFSHQLTQLNLDKCLSEYKQYKRLVTGSYKDKSMLEMTSILAHKYSDELPNILLLLQCCTVIPMTTDQCERGFSTQNRIKNKLRSRLSNKCLVDLMRISEDGPELKQFNFEKALLKWKTDKVRKLYSK